ncbi:MAG: sugar phosphate isomerase/epimerase [Kiritimatiellae bacterium]|nr:sugar phosphate isomerase/epimerase [Kiritimatiellia bacterium]
MTETQKKTPVGLQLCSVSGECRKDLAATLKAVADMGYAGVEPWGYGGQATEWQGRSGPEIRQMLDENGLTCCGMHVKTAALQGECLARTIELNQTLGNPYLIVAADKERMSARDSTLELADILNDVADKLRPHGMRTGYHAHGFDFGIFEGKTAWEILFENTKLEVVMQLDIANCVAGGGDPIALLKKFPGRARSLHLRDYGGGPDSVIGEGEADWPAIFRLCRELHQPEWFVVEEGHKDGLGFDKPRRSLAALKGMGVV